MLRPSCFFGSDAGALRALADRMAAIRFRDFLVNQFRREEDRVQLVLVLREIAGIR